MNNSSLLVLSNVFYQLGMCSAARDRTLTWSGIDKQRLLTHFTGILKNSESGSWCYLSRSSIAGPVPTTILLASFSGWQDGITS